MQQSAQLAKELWQTISENNDPEALLTITKVVTENKKPLVNAFL